jgi:hypothetical protein
MMMSFDCFVSIYANNIPKPRNMFNNYTDFFKLPDKDKLTAVPPVYARKEVLLKKSCITFQEAFP